VLGAGGITGIAWLLGALDAVREHSGWDPAGADVISGTSAGAVAGAVLASGAEPARLLTYAEDQDALDAAIARATRGRTRHQGRGLPWPGSLALAATGLLARRPTRERLAALVGVLPRGHRRTDEIRGLTHEACAGGWPDRELWVHTCDYRTGERVTFGRVGAPDADLADAVAASCALPGFYEPVRIGERRFVDGGLRSFTNADALAGAGCDVVLCLAPFSGSARGPLLDTALLGAARGVTGLDLRREVADLERDGARVAVVEPAEEDLHVMGLNPMDRARSRRVLLTARASVAARLDDLLGDALDDAAPPVRAAA
jgi:NTE family protein